MADLQSLRSPAEEPPFANPLRASRRDDLSYNVLCSESSGEILRSRCSLRMTAQSNCHDGGEKR